MAATVRLRHLATIRNSNVDKKSLEGEQTVRLCNYTDVYYSDRIDESGDFMEATATLDEIDRFTLRESQVLMTKDSETADDIGIPAYVAHDMPGLVCGYHLTQITPGDGLSGRFLAWCLMSRKLRSWFEVSARGVTRFSLGRDAINNASVPASTIPVQHQIADFLDRETARIDALVDKKRRLIGLLDEKRIATITHAVTKGLDPTVPMKDSGIPWIGEIPSHWDVAPTYSRYEVILGKMLSPIASANPDRLPYLRNTNIHWDRIDLSDLAEMHFTPAERMKYRLMNGDLLVCEGGHVGRAAVWDEALAECYFQKALLRATPRASGESQRFLMYVLWAAAEMGVFENEGNQATFVHLTAEKLRAHRFGFPSGEEQLRIVGVLDEERRKLDLLDGRLAAQLSLLTEYREALITAAVTGEIDVESFNGERQVEGVAG